MPRPSRSRRSRPRPSRLTTGWPRSWMSGWWSPKPSACLMAGSAPPVRRPRAAGRPRRGLGEAVDEWGCGALPQFGRRGAAPGSTPPPSGARQAHDRVPGGDVQCPGVADGGQNPATRGNLNRRVRPSGHWQLRRRNRRTGAPRWPEHGAAAPGASPAERRRTLARTSRKRSSARRWVPPATLPWASVRGPWPPQPPRPTPSGPPRAAVPSNPRPSGRGRRRERRRDGR